ncbi:MAG: AAA family ATPase [Candidatus Aminicenantes bacterium]|nr:AAA family ATPase [Candidatus Aminicenantes bacterium]
MKKIAFWSYKGGTGRTLTLCNTAVELMRMGKNVGIIDLDWEAPGVPLLFKLDPEFIEKRPSLTDLIIHRVIGILSKAVHEVTGLVSNPPLRGRLYILPTINSPELDNIKFDDDTFIFLNAIFDNFIQVYMLDYLLIDTRTGFSVTSGLAANFADATFICLRLDRQNVSGVEKAIKGFKINGAKFHLIFSNVPKIKGAEAKIAEVEEKLGAKGEVMLGLVPELILDENLYSLSNPEHELSKSYKKIADIIVSKK